MHPILAYRGRLGLYLGAWLPASGLLATMLAVFSGLPWTQAVVLAVPLCLLYAFVCLASWYPCRAMPPEASHYLEVIAAHSLAAAISSGLWLLAGLGWAMLLDRLPFFDSSLQEFRSLLILFFVVGVLLYLLAVLGHYLLIAFEASREAESRNLELQVKAREAELRALQARREQELAEHELELARSIQRRLLPPADLEGDGFRVAARNVPANFVCGDFYDVFRLPDGCLGLVVADVAGKGIGASLITASVKAMTPLIAADHDLIETVARLNVKLCEELSKREFVVLCIALFDCKSGDLEIVNCGAPDPYLMSRGHDPEPIEVSGPRLPLGVRSDLVYQSRRLQLQPGDRLLLLTDGLPEARTAAGEPLGYEALIRLIGSPQCNGEPSEWLDQLLAEIHLATTEQNEDDLTALLLERLSPERLSPARLSPTRENAASLG